MGKSFTSSTSLLGSTWVFDAAAIFSPDLKGIGKGDTGASSCLIVVGYTKAMSTFVSQSAS